jgi:hypothetical protein
MKLTVDTVRELALDLPSTSEKPCFGTPAWYVKGKLFARALEDDTSIVVKVDFDERAALVAEAPEAYAVTPHYQNYPMVIVRLPKVRRDDLEERLVEAWRFCAPKRLLNDFDAAS